jgi:PAS domain S-box-containing protein
MGEDTFALRLAHLQQLSVALAAAGTLSEALDATLDLGLAVFRADQALIATLEPDRLRFRALAMRGYPAAVLEHWRVFPATDQFPLPEAVQHQRPVIVRGPEELVARYPLLAGTERSATLICLPMGRVGGIALGYERPPAIDEDELEFMAAVARQCGEAVQRTLLDVREAEARARRTAVFHTSLDAIVTADAEGTIIEVNPAAERTFGWPAAELVGRTVRDVLVPPSLRAAHERGLRRHVETGEATIMDRRQELLALHADGHELPVELTLTRIETTAGPLFTATIRDITERRRREATLAFLVEAGETLAASLDYGSTLQRVARLAVPRLSDCCLVDVIEPSGVRQLALVHVDPAREPLVAEIERRFPVDPGDERSAVGDVVRRGRPVLISEVNDDVLDRITRAAEHREAVRRIGMRSLIIVPLLVRGRTIGAITLIRDVSPERFDTTDLFAAQGLAQRAAFAIDNARLYEEQSRIARTLQRSLLPAGLPRIQGLDIAARYAASGKENQVGGDFYDVWKIDERTVGMAIGDMAGKGPAAAANTALVRHSLRAISRYEASPSDVLSALNDEIRSHVMPETFCTLAYVRAVRGDGGWTLTVGCGGHPPPFIRRQNGSVEPAGAPGTLLGAQQRVRVVDQLSALDPGDLLLMYTDGVTERRRENHQFGEERLRRELAGLDPLTPSADIAAQLERDVVAFAHEPPQDDIAILVVRRTAGTAA